MIPKKREISGMGLLEFGPVSILIRLETIRARDITYLVEAIGG